MNGKLHRADGPAVIISNYKGTKEYHYRGEEYYDIYYYYIRGFQHRTGGPAVYNSSDNRVVYWHYGNFHRTDGPAIIYNSVDKVYYINGLSYNEDEFNICSFMMCDFCVFSCEHAHRNTQKN